MTNQEIIALLDYYGHLRAPFGEKRFLPLNLELQIGDQVVHDAIESYQAFHLQAMEPIVAAFYPKRLSAAVKVNGELGPDTLQLLGTARCSCPDYDASLPEELIGKGNWAGCNKIGNFHNCIVRFTNQPPAFLTPLIDAIWNRTVDSYAELGLLFKREDNANFANIDISFVQPDGGWIGLAIVGQGQRCQDKIWARFDKNYKPDNLVSEWTTLIKHELGHNCGLSHSSGGVMNPYIMKGLPVSWNGDPSRPLLVSRFGGEPVPRIEVKRCMVLCWQNGPTSFEVIQEVQTAGGSIWPV